MEPMDELHETELHGSIAGLGNWHEARQQGGEKDKPLYLVNQDDCVNCLKDISIALKQDTAENGYCVRLKLGEWKVFSNHLVPLFTYYRENEHILAETLAVMLKLTGNLGKAEGRLQHLEYMQDYKEAFAKREAFVIIVTMLVDNMDGDDAAEGAPEMFDQALQLLCNLLSVPDPAPGDPGFTPMRRHQQLVYIRHFHEEEVLEIFLTLLELNQEINNEKRGRNMLFILYHVCTHVDPEELTHSAEKDKQKKLLAQLLAKEQAEARLRAPESSRHRRFGTMLQMRTAQGGQQIITSVTQKLEITKGSRVWNREFKDPNARNDLKAVLFHDPFFVDLQEGAVKQHNMLSAHVRSALDAVKNFSDEVLKGMKKFYEDFVKSYFSSLLTLLRSTVARTREVSGDQLDLPTILNFVSWILEFHRLHFVAKVANAQKVGEEPPAIDLTSIQAAIDVEMIQFLTTRLREYGKGANIHSSLLVIVLRAWLQVVKTISLVIDSTESETKDCGVILLQNIVKEDVLFHLAWIIKNFHSSSHDPRVLSYTVEVFYTIWSLMNDVAASKGGEFDQVEWQVDRVHARYSQRLQTTTAKEIAGLADAHVIENLFYLLEKYKRQTSEFNSLLVKLIQKIIEEKPTNIVIFFELSYFIRIYRIWCDPFVNDKRVGVKYKDMKLLLRDIIRRFFRCAEMNGCVFVELLFRKVQEGAKTLLVESTNEFSAILDNYEDKEYSKILNTFKVGEDLDKMRLKQRQAAEGVLPWTEEEDNIIRSQYAEYENNPLYPDLISAMLPEDSKRTRAQILKRIKELGLRGARDKESRGDGDRHADDQEGGGDGAEPPNKRIRVEDEEDREHGTPADVRMDDGAGEDEDLDKLLETMLDDQAGRPAPGSAVPSTAGSSQARPPPSPAPSSRSGFAAGGANGMDLDTEFDNLLGQDLPDTEMGDAHASDLPGQGVQSPATLGRASPAPPSSAQGTTPAVASSSRGSLERDLEEIMEASSPAPRSRRLDGTPGSRRTSRSMPGTTPPPATQTSGAGSLEADLEALLEGGSQAVLGHGTPARSRRASTGAATPPADTFGSLEGDLEALLEESGVETAAGPAGADGGAAVVEEEDPERFWDEAIRQDEATQAGAAGDASAPGSQRADALESDLERIMEEDPDQPPS